MSNQQHFFNLSILFNALILLLINLLSLTCDYNFMLAYVIYSACTFSVIGYLEYKNYKGINLSIIFLMGAVFRLVYPSIEHSLDLLSGKEIEYIDNNVSNYIFPTVVWMNVYYLIFYKVIVKYQKNFNFEKTIVPLIYKYNVQRIAVVLFILGHFANLSPTIANFSSTLSLMLSKFPLISIVLLVINSVYRPSKSSTFLLYILLILHVIISLFISIAKTDFLIIIIVYVLYQILNSRAKKKSLFNPYFLISTTALIVAFLYIIYPFITEKRELLTFEESSNRNFVMAITPIAMSNALDNTFSDQDKQQKGSEVTDRNDAIPVNAFFYGDVQQSQKYHIDFLVHNLETLIPSFIYTKKHGQDTGLMVTGYVNSRLMNGAAYETCSTYVGLFASSYFIGGWLLAIIMAFINGFFITKWFNFLILNINNIFAIFSLIILLTEALMAFEEIYDGGIFRILMFIPFYILIIFSNKYIFHNQ